MKMSSCLRALVVASVLTALFGTSRAADIAVGPNGSWDLGIDYKAWAASQTFRVGDNLVFSYDSSHDVLEVTKSNHDSCGTSNPIKTSTGGNTVVPLSSAGPKYFICGTPGHCTGGMKLEVNVVAGGPTTPTGASSGPTMSPPTESGAADGLRGMVAAGLGLGVLVALAI